jgi:hypothetical protein
MSSFPNMEYEEDASPLPRSTKQEADLLDGVLLSPCASDDDEHALSRIVNTSDPQTVWVRAAPQLPSIQFDDEESDFISPYQERAHLEFNADAIDRSKVSTDQPRSQSKINRSDNSPPESEVQQPPLDTPPASHRRRPRAIKKISSPHSPPTPPLAPRSPRRKARSDRFARVTHTDSAGARNAPELDSFHRPVIATATPRRSHYLRASLLTSTGENKTDKLQLALVPTADRGQQPKAVPLEGERGRRTRMIPLRSRVGVPLSIVVPAEEPTIRSRSCPRKNRPQSSPTVRLPRSSSQTRARAKASQSYSPESPSRRSKISALEQQDTKIGGPAV